MGLPALCRILASVALAFGLAACDVGEFPVEGGGGGADGGGDPLPLTFNGQIQQDLGACTACHGQTPLNNDYQVISYQTTILAVTPGDPAASLLVTEMDPNGPPRAEHANLATPVRFQLYTDWVNAGAPEM
ncbi:MAG: hypothetical protein KJO07_07845 [Deltaproteobacteria bacterium]|nr:hypothetical protein [Deltaproteobacteria bacterium]